MVADINQTYCDHFAICINSKSLCRTTKINIMLYVNYTSIKKEKKRERNVWWMIMEETGQEIKTKRIWIDRKENRKHSKDNHEPKEHVSKNKHND